MNSNEMPAPSDHMHEHEIRWLNTVWAAEHLAAERYRTAMVLQTEASSRLAEMLHRINVPVGGLSDCARAAGVAHEAVRVCGEEAAAAYRYAVRYQVALIRFTDARHARLEAKERYRELDDAMIVARRAFSDTANSAERDALLALTDAVTTIR